MKKNYFMIMVLALFTSACTKEFLDKKPDQALLVPTSLQDFQALLDYSTTMNQTPVLGEVGAGDFYTTSDLNSAIPIAANSYLWLKDINEDNINPDWTIPFRQIFYSNVILDGLDKFDNNEPVTDEYQRVKGSALFFRGIALFNLAQEFASQYQSKLALTTLGLPVRLSANVNLQSKRMGLDVTYKQIIADIDAAVELLPIKTIAKTRPSKPAALALLARIYLVMGDYEKSLFYASECLKLNQTLLNYNAINASLARPFPQTLVAGNEEVLFYCDLIGLGGLPSSALCFIDNELRNGYTVNDLRKTLFFNSAGNFKGSYSGNSFLFAGIAIDEVYLIKSECLARLGRVAEGIDQLNILLLQRYKNGTFIPYQIADQSTAIKLILLERRKELLMRGLRWSDLRRLNLDPNYETTLKRSNNGQDYMLMPNDPRYVLPIPNNEIANSDIEQNER